MGNYQAYEKYKDSGVEWLGNIPEHWKALKIKRLTAIKRGASPRPIDDPKYFDDDGEYAWVRIADVTASDRYLENTTQRLSALGKSFSVPLEPDQLFLSIAGSVGKPMITKIKCCIHDGFVYFPDLKINKELIYYIFHSGQPYLGLGKLGTQLNLNTETVGAITIGLPPLDEQQSIANFLDRKNKQIDDLIAKKEALLAKLDEKRSAIISHAVTKGLDPTVPMKDSGVEWLGDIPEHWEFSKIKFLCKEIISGPFGSSLTKNIYVKSGYKIYGQEQVIANNFSIGDYYISEKKYKEMSRYSVNTGDILISCVGTFGKISVVPEEAEAGIINPRLIKLNLDNKKIEPDYFGTLLSSNISFCQFDKLSRGGTMGIVNIGVLSMIELPIPPLNEQYLINKYLDKKTVEIDLQKTKVQEAIERLKEYRTALITKAVTGKINVRQFSLN